MGVKQPVCEADYSPSSSAAVKSAWCYTSTPQYVMAWCLVNQRDDITFSFTYTYGVTDNVVHKKAISTIWSQSVELRINTLLYLYGHG
jgi:hypothetical protein